MAIRSSTARPFLLNVVKQTSPFEERVTRSGIQRDVHVVIKNSPFLVQLEVARGCDVDLNHIAFEASLLYDTEGEKGVDFVKVKPIEFKAVPSENGDQCAVELRIKVLTSQHEDMFFKVRIQGQDPVTKADIPNLKCITHPIKVISKPEQLKKKQPVVATSKKRTVNDMVVDAITRIEQQQNEQAILIKTLVEQSKFAKLSDSREWTDTTASSKNQDFESSFMSMLKCYMATEPHLRAEKVRRMTRNCSSTDRDDMSELVDMLSTEGLETGRPQAIPFSLPPLSNSTEKMANVFFNPSLNHFGNVVENSFQDFALSNSLTGINNSLNGINGSLNGINSSLNGTSDFML